MDRLRNLGRHGIVFLSLRKTLILKSALTLVVLVIISAGCEFSLSRYELRALDPAGRTLVPVAPENIQPEGFSPNETGAFNSERENASLVIRALPKYVRNLMIEFGNGQRKYTSLSVSYHDQSGTEIPIVKDGLESLEKGRYQFLPFLVFPVHASADSITIHAKNADTTIAKIFIDNTPRFNSYRFAILLAIFAIAAFFLSFRKRIGTKPEYAFLVVAIVCGTLFSYTEKLKHVSWDERVHYNRSDSLSLKQFIPKKVNDIYGKSANIPSSYSMDEQSAINGYFDNDFRKTVSSAAKSKKDARFEIKDIFDFYTALPYLPSGLSLLVGRIIHLPAHIIFTLGRAINLFVFAALVFFAIRKLRTGKMIIATIALLPTAIFLAASYNYDSWLTGFSMLGLATFFAALQEPERKLTHRDTAIMIGVLVIGCAAKAIYFPLLFLLFLLKSAQFSSKKCYRVFLWSNGLAILFVISSFIVPLLSGADYTDERGGKEVNASAQISFILSHTIEYAGTLVRFIGGYINPMNAGGFTTSFAYLGSIDGFAIILTLLVIVTLADKNEFDVKTTSLRIRFFVLGISLATVALIATALYISFTPVGLSTISGVQPRYLIPLLFPILLVIGTSRFRNTLNRNLYNTAIFALLAAIMIRGIWDLAGKLHF